MRAVRFFESTSVDVGSREGNLYQGKNRSASAVLHYGLSRLASGPSLTRPIPRESSRRGNIDLEVGVEESLADRTLPYLRFGRRGHRIPQCLSVADQKFRKESACTSPVERIPPVRHLIPTR